MVLKTEEVGLVSLGSASKPSAAEPRLATVFRSYKVNQGCLYSLSLILLEEAQAFRHERDSETCGHFDWSFRVGHFLPVYDDSLHSCRETWYVC